jgi:homoserine kinase
VNLEPELRVRVPATSANLGPGYDAFGLALDLCNEFEARRSEQWSVRVEGEGAGLLREDASNEVVRAIQRVFSEVQAYDRAADIVCRNRIPVGRGLGSSAAAIVGGVVIGNRLTGERLSGQRLLELAEELEGHPDNVAAALLGGFTVSVREAGTVRSVRVDPVGGVAAVVVVGDAPLATSAARLALPASVPHADAAANAGRAALVALGLATGDDETLRLGLHDLLHEQYRASLMADFPAVCDALERAGVGPAVLSGAGPTVLGLVLGQNDADALARAGSAATAVTDSLGEGHYERVLALGIARKGIVES